MALIFPDPDKIIRESAWYQEWIAGKHRDHTQRIRDSILKYQNKESDDGSVHSDGTTEG